MTRALTRNENYDPYEFMSHKPSVDRVQSQHHKQSLQATHASHKVSSRLEDYNGGRNYSRAHTKTSYGHFDSLNLTNSAFKKKRPF